MNQAAVPGNLLPSPRSGSWTTWVPRKELGVRFGVRTLDRSPCLWMGRPERFESFGKYLARVEGIEAGAWYDLRASYRQKRVRHERVSIVAMLTWLGDGAACSQIRRVYAERLEEEENGWKALVSHVQAPPGSSAVQVELFLRWTDDGEVWWRAAQLQPGRGTSGRVIRAAAAFDPTVYGLPKERILDRAERLIDLAAREKPDILCLTEVFSTRGMERPMTEMAEAVPGGPGSDLLARKAREHAMWIAASLYERVPVKGGEVFYNTAVLYDRRGGLAGTYRKAQISLEEAELGGVSPGRELPVFQTDFGTVGMLICWDHSFSELARILALQGAEMILLPIAGDGLPHHWEASCRLHAIENGVYLVGSLSLRGPSWIVDPNGEILCRTGCSSHPSGGDPEMEIVVAECDLEARPASRCLSVGDTDGERRSVYLAERRVDLYGPLSSPSVVQRRS